jgi:hypothetical protein
VLDIVGHHGERRAEQVRAAIPVPQGGELSWRRRERYLARESRLVSGGDLVELEDVGRDSAGGTHDEAFWYLRDG